MPGLFSRYGVMGNPIVDLLGAASIATAAQRGALQAQQREALPDPQSMIFANQAYQRGEMVDQAPRAPGLFNNLGVKLGLLNPTVGQRPKDVRFELQALSDRRKEEQETLSKEVDWWTKVGTENFKRMQMEPSMQRMTMFATEGHPELDVAGPTVREQAIAAIGRGRELKQKEDLIRLQLAVNEQKLRLDMWSRKQQEPIPGTTAWYNMIGERTHRVTLEHEKTLNELENNDWTEWHRHHPGWELHDADTGAYVGDDKYKTPGEAVNDFAHIKVLKNPVAIKQANSTAALVDMLTMMKSNILSHVLVDPKGKSNATVYAESTLNDLLMRANWWSGYKKEFNAANDMALAFASNIATNHGMTKEVASILHGGLPNLGDNLDVASKKMDIMIRAVKTAGGFALGKIGDADASASARSDFFSDPGLGGDLGTSTGDMPSSSVVPAPSPEDTSGAAALAGIAGGSDTGEPTP